ncbi:hypothetical protein RRG08_053166 [Elysia crispata]|uniref:Uncharacterized protein n=1 Tax=Elysia crispata TaxID=231223 RepID=A0AAE0YQJ1_9GAST|nr:hypothetical protein RRG08_053166 [Elysia crispata]
MRRHRVIGHAWPSGSGVSDIPSLLAEKHLTIILRHSLYLIALNPRMRILSSKHDCAGNLQFVAAVAPLMHILSGCRLNITAYRAGREQEAEVLITRAAGPAGVPAPPPYVSNIYKSLRIREYLV